MSPSYGFCLLQIPCWCEFSFSLVSLGGFPRKWASPSGSHYGKTKYGDKIAPCGRKKWLARYPSSMYLSVFIRVICWRLPLLRMDFLRPQGVILYYILSSWCLPVGLWDCLLEALKAHEETSAHDYQGWLQARPIRDDIKKHFVLLIYWIFAANLLSKKNLLSRKYLTSHHPLLSSYHRKSPFSS